MDDLSLVLLYTFPQSLHRYLNHLSSSMVRFMGPPLEHMLHHLSTLMHICGDYLKIIQRSMQCLKNPVSGWIIFERIMVQMIK